MLLGMLLSMSQSFHILSCFLKIPLNWGSSSSTSSPGQVTFFHHSILANSSNEGSSTAASVPLLSPVSGSSSTQNSLPQSSLSPTPPSHSIHPVHSTHSMITRAKAGIFKPKTYLAVTQDLEPISVKAALQDLKWYSAMKEEFEALQKNCTWTFVPPDTAAKIVGNKWIYRVKYNHDGSISKYKARLVAKGFHQTHGVDFFETFSPVVKSCTVRLVLSLAVMNHWPIRQLDVNNAFLNGVLTEDVFMHQPEGFIDFQYPSYVCKLNKALYGLMQAPRAWYDRLKGSLLQWGFQASKSDTSMFVQYFETDILLILVYVDDILITGSNFTHIEAVIQHLNSDFALKDLGEFSYFLGVEVILSVEGLHLSQTKYIGDILK